MIKRKVIKLSLLLIILSGLIIINDEVNAAEIKWASITQSGGSGPSTGDDGPPETKGVDYGDSRYSCTYSYTFEPGTSIQINGVDLNGKTLMSETTLINEKFKAGTWIGINILETKIAFWNVLSADEEYKDEYPYEYVEYKKQYTCNYEYSTFKERKCTQYMGSNTTSYGDLGQDKNDGLSCKSYCEKKHDNVTKGEWEGDTCKCSYTYTYNASPCWDTYTEHSGTKSYTKKYNEKFECPEASEIYSNYYFPEMTGSSVIEVPETKTLEQIEQSIRENVRKDCENNSIAATRAQALDYIRGNIGQVKYVNSNSYPETEDELGTMLNTISSPKGTFKTTYKDGDEYATELGVYQYGPGSVCMDVFTGNVKYYEETDNCDTKKELDVTTAKTITKTIEVNKDESLDVTLNYWRYFIPLNTKSESKYYIKMEQRTNHLSTSECLSALENHQNKVTVGTEEKRDYINYIRKIPDINNPEKNLDFIGDAEYTSSGKVKTNTKSTDVKSILTDGGCDFSTSILLNITQDFYNEVGKTGEYKFKGFDFYYRPVDITNPFPNTISTNSYWKGYWKDETKANFNNSFDKKTYETELNLREVRENTANIADESIQEDEETGILISGGSYSDWINTMNKDGSSKLISKKTSIIKDPETTYYPLGCGPSNKNWIQCKKSGGNS